MKPMPLTEHAEELIARHEQLHDVRLPTWRDRMQALVDGELDVFDILTVLSACCVEADAAVASRGGIPYFLASAETTLEHFYGVDEDRAEAIELILHYGAIADEHRGQRHVASDYDWYDTGRRIGERLVPALIDLAETVTAKGIVAVAHTYEGEVVAHDHMGVGAFLSRFNKDGDFDEMEPTGRYLAVTHEDGNFIVRLAQ